MPTDAITFEDETAFERLVLDRALPLVAPDTGLTELDLRGQDIRRNATVMPKTIIVSLIDSVGGGGEASLVTDLRPLLFGTAWKILDLVVEWALDTTGVPRDKRGRYTIEDKAERASIGIASLPPFTAATSTWSIVLATYAGTKELRHDLTHRTATVSSDGALTPSAEAQQKHAKQLTLDQQESFCRVAQRLALALIAQDLRPRDESDMLWHLDKLADHHGQPVIGGVAVPIRAFRLTLDATNDGGSLSVDVPEIRARAALQSNAGPYFDLRVHLPDGQVLEADLELLPDTVVSIDALNPGPPFRRV